MEIGGGSEKEGGWDLESPVNDRMHELRKVRLEGWSNVSVLKSTGISAEDPDSIPVTHTVAHNHAQLQFQGIWQLLAASTVTVYMGYTDMHVGKHPST